MIRYDTKKVLIANPDIVFDGFTGFYYLKNDPDQTRATVTLSEKNIRIQASCFYEEEAAEPETHGFFFLIRSDAENASVYTMNIKTDKTDKNVVLAQERRYPAIPLRCDEVIIIDRKGAFEADVLIPFEKIGMPDGISPGRYVELTVLKYRVARQPRIFASIPVRTSYYTDYAKDEKGNCVSMKFFSVSADIINQARFHRIYYGFAETSEYRMTQEEYTDSIPAVLEYISFTDKRIVFRSQKEKINNIKLYWKEPDKTTVPVTVTEEKNRTDDIVVRFSHPEPVYKGSYELHILMEERKSAVDKPVKRVMIISFDKHDLYQAGKEIRPSIAVSRKPKRNITNKDISKEAYKLAELIPEKSGIYWTGSPTNPHLWPYEIYNWDPQRPDEIALKKDGSVWPDGKIIENKKQVVKNDFGEEVEYPYYEDENKKRYFLSAHIWYLRRKYVLMELPNLAQQDPLGAAYVLVKLTDAFKKYVPMFDHYWRGYPVEKRFGPPYPYEGGIWTWWDLYYLRHAADALCSIKETDALTVLSEQMGFDVYDKLVNELFRPSVDFILTYKSYNSNMDYCVWLGLAAISKAIDEPDYMHDAYERMINYMANTMLFDGFFMETTLSYHNQSIGGIQRVAERMKGYSDPEGYISPLTGKRFDNLDPLKDFFLLEASVSMPEKLSYPDGRLLPLQDTWANDRRKEKELCEDYEKSMLAPAAGVAKLAFGFKEKASQLYLMFTAKYGHEHLDPLNITFYAYGCEMLPDIGYNYTKYRSWSASTLAHNTVTVNSSDADYIENSGHGGNIEVFEGSDPIVQIIKASQNTAYSSAEEYSRELWRIATNRDSSDAGYIVDLFRVTGGSCHEYTLNYDANHDAEMTVEGNPVLSNRPLIPPEVNITMPEKALDKGNAQGYYYGYIYPEKTKQVRLDKAEYRIVARSYDDTKEEKAGMVIHGFSADKESELLLCQVPSVRATRLYGTAMDTNDEADKYRLPKMILRRRGENLDSLFIHILEPFDREHPLQIEKTDILRGQAKEEDVALVVTYGDTKDYIFRLSEGSSFSYGDILIEGKRGFIREKNGKVTEIVLIGGTRLQKGSVAITGQGQMKGKIHSVMRKAKGDPYNAFVTEDPVPFDIKGRTLIVKRPDGHTFGYRVEDVLTQGQKTRIVLGNMDPGFEIAQDGTSSMVFYPFTSFEGEYTFTVDDIALYGR
jgi:hypothetical protein